MGLKERNPESEPLQSQSTEKAERREDVSERRPQGQRENSQQEEGADISIALLLVGFCFVMFWIVTECVFPLAQHAGPYTVVSEEEAPRNPMTSVVFFVLTFIATASMNIVQLSPSDQLKAEWTQLVALLTSQQSTSLLFFYLNGHCIFSLVRAPALEASI
ncbi:hypothetical protein Efla_004190 [Eimeria flavescens]